MLEIKHAKDSQRSLVTLLLFLLVFLLPLLYFETLHNPSALPRYALTALIAGLSLLTMSAYIIRGACQVNWHVSHLIAVAFLILASLSATWSIDAGSNLIAVMYLVSFVILFFVATQTVNINSIRMILMTSVVAGGIAALIGVMQHFNFNPMQYRGPVMASTFTFKNHAALYFDLIIPVACLLIFTLKNTKLKLLMAVCLGLCLGFIAEARTRGSYLALLMLVLIVVSVWLLNKKYRAIINTNVKLSIPYLFLVVVIVMAIILPPGRNDVEWEKPMQNAKTTDNEVVEVLRKNIDSSSLDRLLFYKNSLGIIRENPVLGTGYGTFWKAFRVHMNHPYLIKRSHADIYLLRLHNDILQIFTELGVLGGFIFLSFLGIVIVNAISFIRNENNGSTQRLIATGLLLSVIACLVHSLVDFPFHKPASAATFWLWCGLIIALYSSTKRVTVRTKYPALTGWSLAGFSLFYLIIGIVFYIGYFRDNYYFYLAEEDVKKNDCMGAMVNIEKAINNFGLFMMTHAVRTRIHIYCNNNPQQLFLLLNSELQYDDTNINALTHRAELLMSSGYLNEAERDLRKILFILPHSSNAKVGLARILIKKGQKDAAIVSLKAIVEEHPDSRLAKKYLEEALRD